MAKKTKRGIWLHPLQRIVFGLGAASVTFGFVHHLPWILVVPILWLAFSGTFIITSTIIFFTMPIPEIVQKANQEDGSRLLVFTSILCSAFAGMLTVLVLMLSNQMHTQVTLTVMLSVGGMMASWLMVHTIFTFHYAHMYYRDDAAARPLEFPGKSRPDYLDFAYFSFVIGMTFQVSDVEIASPRIRRVALAHGLLSFMLNTFVVALTINLIAGLRH